MQAQVLKLVTRVDDGGQLVAACVRHLMQAGDQFGAANTTGDSEKMSSRHD